MKTITNINQLDLNKLYSYADYLLWKFEERIELIKGKIFKMSPAPSSSHQNYSFSLSGEFYIYFKDKQCQAFSAPFDVRIPTTNEQGDEITTVVQPDICVVCDLEKIDHRGCLGAPNLVVEILSPGNSKKEMDIKFSLYEEAGVEEYWIIDPNQESVIVYVLENGIYIGLKPVVDNYIVSKKFPDLQIHSTKIFEKKF